MEVYQKKVSESEAVSHRYRKKEEAYWHFVIAVSYHDSVIFLATGEKLNWIGPYDVTLPSAADISQEIIEYFPKK